MVDSILNLDGYRTVTADPVSVPYQEMFARNEAKLNKETLRKDRFAVNRASPSKRVMHGKAEER